MDRGELPMSKLRQVHFSRCNIRFIANLKLLLSDCCTFFMHAFLWVTHLDVMQGIGVTYLGRKLCVHSDYNQ